MSTRIENDQHHVQEIFRALEVMVIIVAIVFVLLGSYAQSFGDTADSRLATVYALANFDTWRIDRPEGEPPIVFEQRTIDKVTVDGKLLSSKPPMLPLMMTGEYLLLNKVGTALNEILNVQFFPVSLDDPEDTNEIIRIMSITLIGLAYVIGLIFFLKTLRLFVDDGMSRFVCVGALAFATQLWGYATNINNHMPGAAAVIVALYFALGLASGKLPPSAWRFFAFGLAGGLAPTLDMPGAIFVFAAGLYLVFKLPRQTLIWTSIGAAIPLGVHFAIMWAATGSPIPVQSRKELYLYETSYWRNPRGIDALNEPKLVYLLHMTFGRVGLFMLFPVLFLGLLSGLAAIFRKTWPSRGMVLGGLAAFAVLTAYYVKSTNNYGGEAFGFRWYIVAMPVLMLMAAPLMSRLQRGWQWMIVGVLIGVSFYSAWQCAVSPWGSNREWTIKLMGRSYDFGPG